MAEPSSSTALAAGLLGAGFAGALAGVDGNAAVGSLCGALIYFASAGEVPMRWRLVYFVISFVMGYLFSPVLAKAELFGIGPIDMPGPAAFICAALVVTVTLAAIRSRGQPRNDT